MNTALLEHCCIAPLEHSGILVLAHCYILVLAHYYRLVLELCCKLLPLPFLEPAGIAGWALIGTSVLELIGKPVLEHSGTLLWLLVLEHSGIPVLEHLSIVVWEHCCKPLVAQSYIAVLELNCIPLLQPVWEHCYIAVLEHLYTPVLEHCYIPVFQLVGKLDHLRNHNCRMIHQLPHMLEQHCCKPPHRQYYKRGQSQCYTAVH